MLKVVEHFEGRYVILLNDFLTFLSEMLDDEEAEVNLIAKNIVKLIEQNTGEDVYNLIKNSQF